MKKKIKKNQKHGELKNFEKCDNLETKQNNRMASESKELSQFKRLIITLKNYQEI